MDKILTIKIWKKWKNWIDIHWKIINYEESFKLDLKKFISEWNEYIWIKSEKDTEGNQVYTLIAKENIYINLIKSSRSSHELRDHEKWKIVWVIAWKEEIINKTDIWMNTKNMEVKNLAEFHQKWNIENIGQSAASRITIFNILLDLCLKWGDTAASLRAIFSCLPVMSLGLILYKVPNHAIPHPSSHHPSSYPVLELAILLVLPKAESSRIQVYATSTSTNWHLNINVSPGQAWGWQ